MAKSGLPTVEFSYASAFGFPSFSYQNLTFFDYSWGAHYGAGTFQAPFNGQFYGTFIADSQVNQIDSKGFLLLGNVFAHYLTAQG